MVQNWWQVAVLVVLMEVLMVAGMWLLDRLRHRRDVATYRRLRREEREYERAERERERERERAADLDDDGDGWKVH